MLWLFLCRVKQGRGGLHFYRVSSWYGLCVTRQKPLAWEAYWKNVGSEAVGGERRPHWRSLVREMHAANYDEIPQYSIQVCSTVVSLISHCSPFLSPNKERIGITRERGRHPGVSAAWRTMEAGKAFCSASHMVKRRVQTESLGCYSTAVMGRGAGRHSIFFRGLWRSAELVGEASNAPRRQPHSGWQAGQVRTLSKNFIATRGGEGLLPRTCTSWDSTGCRVGQDPVLNLPAISCHLGVQHQTDTEQRTREKSENLGKKKK